MNQNGYQHKKTTPYRPGPTTVERANNNRFFAILWLLIIILLMLTTAT